MESAVATADVVSGRNEWTVHAGSGKVNGELAVALVEEWRTAAHGSRARLARPQICSRATMLDKTIELIMPG